MQYLFFLLFSFEGRISRGGFWLGLAIIAVLTIGGLAVLQPEIFDFEVEKLPPPNFASNVWSLCVLVPSMAITVKRLNDRNWSSWIAVAVFLFVLPFHIGPFFGTFWDIENPTLVEGVMWAALGLLAIFLLVDNGVLRGSEGENRYGPDPR
ncbi:MAG: DUF805 domain-containing protein [Pseudomonadota bacterium]